MRTKLIDSSVTEMGWGPNKGDNEAQYYECPCGSGRILEDHDNIPGFRNHDVIIECDTCKEAWDVDMSKGVRSWELVPKAGA